MFLPFTKNGRVVYQIRPIVIVFAAILPFAAGAGGVLRAAEQGEVDLQEGIEERGWMKDYFT